MSETLAEYINGLAGEYVENWVCEQLAEEWQNDKDEIERLNKRHEDFLQEFWATNAENAKLQAVVDAARDFVNNHMDHDDAMRIFDALAALEGDDE